MLNPAVDDMEKLRENPEQRLDLIVAGTKDAVMMVESEAYELSETEMLGAVKFGHEQMQPVIDMIIDMAETAAKEPFAFAAPDYADLYAKVKGAGEQPMRAAFAIRDKLERQNAVSAAKDDHQGRADRGRTRRSPTSTPASRSSNPKSSAGTSSTTAAASTAGT